MKILFKNLHRIKITPKFYLDLPENPGVYVYFKGKTPIYVGKAINLKNRVASYFRLSLEPKTEKMISEAGEISYIKVVNELEALLLEAKLIKLYLPKYNIALKDDKHPLYIIITSEKFPRVLTARKPDLKKFPTKAVYGPFPSSTNVKSVLKMIRRIFPFSDHKVGKRACLYSQIGLCDPCPSEISNIKDYGKRQIMAKKYNANIRKIKSLLDGKIENVKKQLSKEMDTCSGNQMYEEAGVIRDQIKRFEYITSPRALIDPYLTNPNFYEDIRVKETLQLKKILEKHFLGIKKLERIECFDVAHLQGTGATASMVTFVNGTPEKSLYRHFRILQLNKNDDYGSMREIAGRRKNNLKKWGKPDLIIVDGGAGQLSVFLKVFENEQIPVVGLAKRLETLVIPVKKNGVFEIKNYKVPKGDALNLIQRIRDEAHRFARVYHHKLIKRSLFEKEQ
ncbi:MAG: hypothetical protein ACD_13C00196G0001 [uncultured bacterium]|nr:MAG: hypothetical protein ACD_13C00196G0001 [uncultured bacterium]